MAQPDSPGESQVAVSIDGVSKKVHRGSHTVAELKSLLGIASLLDLDQEIGGVLTPLANDQRVTIKGGEVFFSHARTGGSS